MRSSKAWKRGRRELPGGPLGVRLQGARRLFDLPLVAALQGAGAVVDGIALAAVEHRCMAQVEVQRTSGRPIGV